MGKVQGTDVSSRVETSIFSHLELTYPPKTHYYFDR